MKKRKIGIVIIILAACLCFVTAYAENAAAEPEASSYPNSVNHFYDENPGTFHLEVGESKTLTAEFRGIIGDMPDSWQPVYQWTIYGNDVVELTTNTLDQGKATIAGVKPGKADLMVNTGEYGVRIISVIVETAP